MKQAISCNASIFWLLFSILFPLPVYAVSAGSHAALRMIVIPMRPPSRMYRDFLPLKHYLEKKLDQPIDLDVARKNSEIAQLFEKKEIDIAFVCPTLYCDLTRAVSVVPLVKLRINGSDQYRSVLVVRKDSPIYRTADLYDRTLVYGRYYCPGSGLLPRIMFKRVGLSENDFLEVVNLGNDESALLAVMARMFDVTGVPEMAVSLLEEKNLRILRYSDPIPQYLFVARNGMDEKFIQKLKEEMLGLNHDADKQAIIGGIEKGVDGFSEAKDSDYDIVRVLIESLDGGAVGSAFSKGEHTLVVEPLYYDADLFRRLKPFLSRLRSETGWNYHLRIPESIKAFLKDKEEGKGDFYLQEAGLFSQFGTSREESIGSLSLVPKEANRAVIVVPGRGAVKRLKDLRGKTVGVPSRFSEGGFLAQTRWLKNQGIPQDSIRVKVLGTCENVLMNVYLGKVDAGFVTLDTFQRLEKDLQPKRVVILGETPPLGDWVITARKNVPDVIRKKVGKILEEEVFRSPRN
ncbi:MAG: phosphate/phosphite/phosphonate ABC transporter substrate-binding protein [Deltaproteobacteria bacterium]|nr:phosphate/phosphite/phosphonate ABC transporter substrate-binding protein [Deltaproteobacteria bacterium]